MDRKAPPADATRTTTDARALALRDKATLTTGANYWLTQAAPAIGLPPVRMASRLRPRGRWAPTWSSSRWWA